MRRPKLTDLPPEALDIIVASLPPSAKDVASLGATNRHLHEFVEHGGWQTFNHTRFPSLCPLAPPSHREVARSLTDLSKSWDRRALIAQCVEPEGDICAFPGGHRLDKWSAPKGQTMGFIPQLDAYERVGPGWSDRYEVLACSTGAELCLRLTNSANGNKQSRWITYRPPEAREGRDDITCLHLLPPRLDTGLSEDSVQVITGTANGNLRLLHVPVKGGDADVRSGSFATKGRPVRSSSILHRNDASSLLVTSLGDDHVAIYEVDPSKEHQNTEAKSEATIIPPPSDPTAPKLQRVWSTSILNSDTIAIGLGISQHPIQIHSYTPTGLLDFPTRHFALSTDLSSNIDISSAPRSSVYTITPLEPYSAAGGSLRGTTFLSGAYDGLARLHDLRTPRDAELIYQDSKDDGAIYSLLCRGQETLVAGTNRHRLLKFFDMRLGSKAYSYIHTSAPSDPNGSLRYNLHTNRSRGWNLFVSNTGHSRWGKKGAHNTRSQYHQNAESPIYSLAASSSHSPFLYVGAVGTITELASVEALDQHPDPAFFKPWTAPRRNSTLGGESHGREILDMAMYDQTADMKLYTQRSIEETWRSRQSPTAYTCEFPKTEGLDARWTIR